MEELEILPEGVSPEQELPKEEAAPPGPSGTEEAPVFESPAVVVESEAVVIESPAAVFEPLPPIAEPSIPAPPDPEAGLTVTEPPAETSEPPVATSQTSISMEELLASGEVSEEVPAPVAVEDTQLRAVLEAIVYVAEEPLTLVQISTALQQPAERVRALLEQLVAEFDKPEHGVTVREVAGGYKMATKAEHHEAVRSFVKSLKPPLKLSLPALETLAVIAYKQPVTSPEIMEIRGVRGAGVLNTLLDRKLIAAAGRKNVIGKPILYKTTKEFLIQFGLKDLSELPSLKEFEEIRRMAFADSEVGAEEPPTAAQTVADPVPSASDQAAAEQTDAEPGPVES
jgi:segregation and condensation protein B